ncbi:MAG TPA: HupE/UreJ family protein [Devosia sp.]|jgi:urease accessory protein|nr:HupE/UreJ family protein [Devosia sp.]
MTMRLFLALTTLLLSPSLTFAHSGGHAGGFVHGFEHPIGGIDHVLAMVAVGVFAFVLGGRALWAVPLSFVGMMLVGFLLGSAQIGLPHVELGIAASSIAIGALAAAGRSLPVSLAAVLVGIFAVFHGHAHGAEMPADASGLTYGLGFLVATGLLHLIGIGVTAAVAKLVGRHGTAIARLAGGALTLGGVGVLAGWL